MAEQTQTSSEPTQEVVQETPQEEITNEAVSIEQPQGETQEQPQTFDPAAITDPNLQLAYKQMQADYTTKMQALATERQQLEPLKQYAPVIEQMLKAQQGGQGQAERENPALQQLEQQLREAGYDDASIKAMKMGADFTLKHFNQQQQAQQEYTRIDSGIKEAASVDPRLNDASLTYEVGDGQKVTFGQIVERLVASDPNWKKDPVSTTKQAIKQVDAMINGAKTQGKQELSEQAKVKAKTFPQVNSSPQGAQDTSKPMSVEEAANMALKQLGMSAHR